MATDASALTADQLAQVLDLQVRRIHKLVELGVLQKSAPGRFALLPCVKAYIRYLRGDGGEEDEGRGVTAKETATAKSRMVAARARVAELEADQLEGTLLPRDEVEKAWGEILLNVRSRLLTVPNKAAPLAFAAQTPTEASAHITTAVHDALAELARRPVYDAPDKRSAPRGGGGPGGAPPAGAAAGSLNLSLG